MTIWTIKSIIRHSLFIHEWNGCSNSTMKIMSELKFASSICVLCQWLKKFKIISVYSVDCSYNRNKSQNSNDNPHGCTWGDSSDRLVIQDLYIGFIDRRLAADSLTKNVELKSDDTAVVIFWLFRGKWKDVSGRWWNPCAKDFSSEDSFNEFEYRLHRALEAVFIWIYPTTNRR